MVAIAHVGFGYWGRNIARNLSQLSALAGIVDVSRAAAQEAASSFGVSALSFAEALADEKIDAVSIASPAESHYELGKQALEAGKHVFIEKPLALRVAEAEELCSLAAERRLVLMVGHLLQYHPVYLRLLEIIRNGELGPIQYAYSNRLSLGKFRTEENVLWSFAPHDISMLLGLFGGEPVDVTAQGHVAFTPGIADYATVQMKFPDGRSAHLQVSWMHPFKEQRLVVIGEKAMAVFEDSAADWADKLRIYDHRIDRSGPVPVPEKAEPRRVEVPRGEPLKEECLEFIRAIETRSEPRTGGQEGLRVLRVLDRAEQALRANLEVSR